MKRIIKIIKKEKGFTLIELIVTIAVLGVLVLLASPRFFGYTQSAELTKGFANAKSIEKASELYYMDHEDWPRLTDEPYTSEEIESYSERIFDRTGQEVNLDPEGNYYDIDYDKLSDYIKVPDDKKNYILQNPVGKVFYMDNLNETGVARVDYSKKENNNPIPIGEPIDFAYTGQPESIELGKGTYKLEVWGAQGGYNTGGKGGYSSGTLSIREQNTLHVYVGQKGKSGTTTRDKSFNGGGYGNTSTNGIRSHGGGASDIRLIGGSWNDTKGLYSRIIVAGGGGGGYLFNGISYLGGEGGGINGNPSRTSYTEAYGEGGTQTSGGKSLFSSADSLMHGSFGVGGDGNPIGAKNTYNGGGGGWYGGGGGNSAGGGSGYALTESSHKPSGYNVSEELYLEDTQLIPGDQSMPNPNGGDMVGNSGHGFARITRVD